MELIKLKNEKLEVTLCDIGASIFRLLFDGTDMLVGPSNINDFLRKDLYFGKSIGRICGRIKNNKGEIVLHGGIDGFAMVHGRDGTAVAEMAGDQAQIAQGTP